MTVPDPASTLPHLRAADRRHWTTESCKSFTGRILGLYANNGTVTFGNYNYRGDDAGGSVSNATAGP